jgi:hypothetical protein
MRCHQNALAWVPLADKRHEDTSISLEGMTIEEALKRAVNAGPYEKDHKDEEPKKAPSRPARRTSRAARPPARKE